jgi:hypothetical protein
LANDGDDDEAAVDDDEGVAVAVDSVAFSAAGATLGCKICEEKRREHQWSNKLVSITTSAIINKE